MRNKNYHSTCTVIKKKTKKGVGICKFYSKLQEKYADILDSTEDVVEYSTNKTFKIGEKENYTSDFYIKKADGNYSVRECFDIEQISRPKIIHLIALSHDFWTNKGIKDWGLVVGAK